MKKILIGVFAHPDDEAFGVSPTLIKEIDEGAEAHIITLTAGESGINPDNHETLSEVRLDEGRRGGELMGVTSMHHLAYQDGKLSNNDLLPIAQQIRSIVEPIISRSDAEADFLGFDFNGISGHIDHIVASRALALAFYQLKEQYPEQIARLRLRCLSLHDAPSHDIAWLYMDAGRCDNEINETVDARAYHDQIVAVIRAHHTQRSDGETHIARYGNNLGINHFIVKQ